jgi:hypothetical protein
VKLVGLYVSLCVAHWIVLQTTAAAIAHELPAPTWSTKSLTVLSSDGCIAHAALAQRLEARFHPATKMPLVHVTVVQSQLKSKAAQLHIEIKQAQVVLATRTFNRVDGSCEDLTDALALAIVLALEAMVQPPEVTALEPAIPTPGKISVADAPRSPRWNLSAASNVFPSVLSTSVIDFEIGGGLRLDRRWWLHLGGARSLSSHASLASGSTAFTLNTARTNVCVNDGAQPFSLFACVGAMVSVVAANGEGFSKSMDVKGLWAAGTLRIGSSLLLSQRWSLVGAVEGLAGLQTPCFDVVDGAQVTYATRCVSKLSSMMSLGVSATLP